LFQHKPFAEGGLSVKDPSVINKAAILLLCWNLITSEEQWSKLCRIRFLYNGKSKDYHITFSIGQAEAVCEFDLSKCYLVCRQWGQDSCLDWQMGGI